MAALARQLARDWKQLLQTFTLISSGTESLGSVDHLAPFSPGHNLDLQNSNGGSKAETDTEENMCQSPSEDNRTGPDGPDGPDGPAGLNTGSAW